MRFAFFLDRLGFGRALNDRTAAADPGGAAARRAISSPRLSPSCWPTGSVSRCRFIRSPRASHRSRCTCGLIPVTALLWPTVFYFQGLYQRRRLRSRFDEAGAGGAGGAAGDHPPHRRPRPSTGRRTSPTRGSSCRSLPVSTSVLVAFSAVDDLGHSRRVRRSGGNLQMVLVVGAGELGKRLVESLQAHREYGFSVVGFLDDDPGKQKRKIQGVPVLGTTQDLEAIAASRRVDQVMIALPLAAHHRTVQLIRACGQLLVEIKVVPDLLQYYVVRAGIEELDGLPIINLTQIPLEGWNQIVKRAFDVVGAAACSSWRVGSSRSSPG